MGAEIAVALALAAASAGTTYYNNKQTAKRQDNQLAAQLRGDAAKQRQADAQTADLINKVKTSSATDEKQGSLAQFTNAIQANRANAEKPLTSLGAVSDAYKKSGSDAALGMASKAGGLADLISSIDAPTQQRQNDKRIYDDYDTNIGLIKRSAAGDDFLSQMKLRGIKRNPWLDAVSQTAGGMASSYGGGGGGASFGGAADPNLYSSGGYTYNLPSY